MGLPRRANGWNTCSSLRKGGADVAVIAYPHCTDALLGASEFRLVKKLTAGSLPG